MSFHLTIQGGEEDGTTFVIDGQCVIGRAPACQLRLSDPQVSWEHAALSDQDGKLFLQSLSAAGVQVADRKVTGEVRVGNGDEVDLPGGLKILIEERVGGNGRQLQVGWPVILGSIAICIVVFIAAANALREDERPLPPKTIGHWRTAHQRLEVRLVEWEARGEFPEEAIALFRDAWRLEIALNPAAAAPRWDSLRSLILTLPMPGEGYGGRTIAESAGPTSRALDVIMDWAPDTSMSMDSRWRTDDTFADALSWFAQKRAKRAHEKLEAGQ
ncbi:MAG: hypothetical protein ACI82F_001148 [Planctomycetota bacterium]|jgi:hypothetical protein